GAGEMDLVAGINADYPNVLAGCLRAIARTARYPELHLGRRPRAPHELLDPDAEPGGILGTEPAPLRTDAGLHRAQPLGIGVAGNKAGIVEVGPYRRQILLLDAE